MATRQKSPEDPLAEIADLRNRLEEAEDTLRAIREGEVDALVVSGPVGEQIFTLRGADYSYRHLIEAINEGAATVAPGGDILYANRRLAEILGTTLERLIGTVICNFVEAGDQALFMGLLEQGRKGASKGEISLRNQHGEIVPALLSFNSLELAEVPGAVCLVVTDLSEQKRQEAILAEGQLSRTIFEQAETVIVVVDAQGRIIRASHKAHELYHESLLLRQFDEVLQLATFDMAAKAGPAAYRPFSISPILQGRIYHGLEVNLYPPEAPEPLAMLLNAGPLRGSGGEVMGAVVALTDITERQRAEAEREALSANIRAQAEELQLNNEELASQAEELTAQAEELQARNEEQDRLVKELRDSEERYRRLVELSPDAILVHDGGSYMYANPATARLFGAATPEELVGQPVLDPVPLRHRDQMRKRMQQSLRGEATELQGTQILTLDGQPVDVEASCVGIIYQGRPAVQMVLRDITERKQKEAALEAAHMEVIREKNRLEAVMEALPVGVAILDERGGNILSNSMFDQIWGPGRPPTQEVSDYTIYKAWWLDTGKPVQPEEWASAQAIKKGEAVTSQLMKIESFDGTPRFIINSAAPILDAAGKVSECAVAILDITELQQAREALKESEERLQQAAQAGRMFAFEWDTRTDKVVRSAECANILGLSDGDERSTRSTSQDYFAMIHPDDRQRLIQMLEGLNHELDRYVTTYRVIRPNDGVVIALEERGRAFFDAAGRLERLFGMTMDITERQRAEEALKQAYDELESKVEERTAALRHAVTQLQEEVMKRRRTEAYLQDSEARLRHLTSQLLTAQEAERGRLALELHDDLGQSLTVLKMQLRAVQNQAAPESSETRESLEHILTYVNEIIGRIRRLSRNLRPAILEDLGLMAALRHLFEEFAPQNIRVTIDADDIQELFSQEAQLIIYRIFQESFNNIAKYAHASQVSVSIKKQNGSVAFQVEDDGRGFDYQETVRESVTERGLGLSAMNERARMLGGSLTIWSQEGSGTKITLLAPIQEKESSVKATS